MLGFRLDELFGEMPGCCLSLTGSHSLPPSMYFSSNQRALAFTERGCFGVRYMSSDSFGDEYTGRQTDGLRLLACLRRRTDPCLGLVHLELQEVGCLALTCTLLTSMKRPQLKCCLIWSANLSEDMTCQLHLPLMDRPSSNHRRRPHLHST